MNKNKWIVYIIEAQNGFLYCGITTDLKRRFEEHKSSKKGAKFFRRSKPKKIVFQKSKLTHSKALKLEAKIKKLSRAEKLKLIK